MKRNIALSKIPSDFGYDMLSRDSLDGWGAFFNTSQCVKICPIQPQKKQKVWSLSYCTDTCTFPVPGIWTMIHLYSRFLPRSKAWTLKNWPILLPLLLQISRTRLSSKTEAKQAQFPTYTPWRETNNAKIKISGIEYCWWFMHDGFQGWNRNNRLSKFYGPSLSVWEEEKMMWKTLSFKKWILKDSNSHFQTLIIAERKFRGCIIPLP